MAYDRSAVPTRAARKAAVIDPPVLPPPPQIENLIQQIADGAAPQELEQPMANESFDADLVVIGAGPGGYVGAIRAAQLGLKVVVVEKEFLGGTCLNVGCIPSKAMIASVERLNHVRHAEKMGIKLPGAPEVDFAAMMARKDKVVLTQRNGVGALFKKNGIRHVQGFASFEDRNTVTVTDGDQKQTVRAKNFLLAMGSGVIYLPIPGLEGGVEAGIWTSDQAVNAPFIPKSMLVIGGGAVGCEFGYVFNGLGSQVTLVELQDSLIPLMEGELGIELAKVLGRQGIAVRTGSSVQKAEKTKDGWKCFVKMGETIEEIEAQIVLLGVGRKAMVDHMNLEKIGVKLGKRGVELKDDSFVTHAPNVYAIGDVHGRIQLAHVASSEALLAVRNIALGESRLFDYKAVPNCVYTNPEVASVGLTEAEAKQQGYDTMVGKARFGFLGKSMAIGESDGFVKVVAERKYGELLGVHMIGAHVTDLIAAAVAAIKLEATVDIMADTMHAHPTLAEAMLEAYEDALGHAIHKMS